MRTMIFAGLSALAMVAPGASRAQPDRGGVTFDFAALSEKWYPSGGRGPNIVPPGEWTLGKPHIWVYPAEIPADAPVRARVRSSKAVTLVAADGEMRLEIAPALKDDAGSKRLAALVGVACVRSFAFDGTPGEYELSFDYSHICDYRHGSRVTVLKFSALDEKGATLATASAPLGTSGVRIRGRKAVKIPEGTARISLTWDLNGVGSIVFREPALCRLPSAAKEPTPPIVLRNSVPHNLDGTFCVPEGQCGAYTLE